MYASRRPSAYLVSSLAALGLLLGCGDPSEDDLATLSQSGSVGAQADAAFLCPPGASGTCVGPAGCQGEAVCAADGGAWSGCICRADCDAQTQWVYLLTDDARVARFDPATNQLSSLGALGCAITPSSMAVDRHGHAYVHASDGRLFLVALPGLSCTELVLSPGFSSTFGEYGMGFASDVEGGEAETLYVGARTGLGRIDVATPSASTVGHWGKGNSGPAELTSLGSRLFGLFVHDISRVLAEIDPATGAVARTMPVSLPAFTSWALAGYGGALYLFTDAQVRRYDPATETASVVVSDAGLHVVGAGSSTCLSGY